MKKSTTHHLVQLAFMSALATILYIFEFPLPGTGLQFDLSDLPVIITGSMFGIVPAVLVALIKNIAHLFFLTRNAGLAGEIANFAFAVLMSVPVSFFKRKNRYQDIGIAFLTVLSTTLIMGFFNYYVTFPLYGMSKVGAWEIINSIYTPFNLIKGSLLMLFFTLSRPYLDRLIRK